MTRMNIVGAGQAGSPAAFALRTGGFEGDIILIGDEPALPYQRPPRQKPTCLARWSARLFLRPETSYADENIELRLDLHITAIDPNKKMIRTDIGALSYDDLILTTGSTPIHLPDSIGGVFAVRTLADINAMQAEFTDGCRVLIIGGGYIGLETAAVAASKGLSVTLVEMRDRSLQRLASPETSNAFRALHDHHGGDIRERVGLARLPGEDRVSKAELSNGDVLDVDFVIVGLGIRHATELAEQAGLTIDNGIAVDPFGGTSDPNIWAAGDCASFPQGDKRLRLESVPNAIDHAEAVASNILEPRRPISPSLGSRRISMT